MAIVTGVVEHCPKVALFRHFLGCWIPLLFQKSLQLINTTLCGTIVKLHFLANGVLFGHKVFASGGRVLFRVVGCVQLQLGDVFVGGPWGGTRKRRHLQHLLDIW